MDQEKFSMGTEVTDKAKIYNFEKPSAEIHDFPTTQKVVFAACITTKSCILLLCVTVQLTPCIPIRSLYRY